MFRDSAKHVIFMFSGVEPVEPTEYAKTVYGFQNYMRNYGVKYFTAYELCEVHRPEYTNEPHFLPDHDMWDVGVALALISDKLRRKVNEPVFVRNWWRPEAYNKAVNGKPESDHIEGFSFDLDFSSKTRKNKALKVAKNIQRWFPSLRMSLGNYSTSIHLGILSDKGERNWGKG